MRIIADLGDTGPVSKTGYVSRRGLIIAGAVSTALGVAFAAFFFRHFPVLAVLLGILIAGKAMLAGVSILASLSSAKGAAGGSGEEGMIPIDIDGDGDYDFFM